MSATLPVPCSMGGAKRAVALAPACPESHALLGWIALEENRFGEAAAAFGRALRVRADDLPTLRGLREALILCGRMRAAFDACRDVCLRLYAEKAGGAVTKSGSAITAIKIASQEIYGLTVPRLNSPQAVAAYSQWLPATEKECYAAVSPDCFCRFITNVVVYGAETLVASGAGVLFDTMDYRVWGYSFDHIFTEISNFSENIRNRNIEICRHNIVIPNYQWKWNPNYYHFMVECLPAVIMFWRMFIANDSKLLIDAAPPYVRDALDLVGVPADAVIEVDAVCRFFPAAYVIDRINTESYPRPMAVRLVRDHFREALKLPAFSGDGRRVYITRNDARERRVMNEGELLGHLRPLGFQVVECGALSLAEQVALFSHATFVIAPHGANLTNIMFMPSGTVVEIVSDKTPNETFWGLACAVGLNYAGFMADTVDHADGQDFRVDCGAFMAFVEPLF